jgi:hypothetical protein
MMIQKCNLHGLSILLTSAALSVLVFCGRAAAQSPALGKNYDEVVKLAVKEGRVRVGSGLTVEEAPFVLEGFNQKYPTIKIKKIVAVWGFPTGK